MEQISSFLQTSQAYSSDDNRPYAQKRAEWQNNEVGHLNEQDGIDCPICKNKGVIWVYEEGCPVLSQKPCECMAKRKSVSYAKHSGLNELLKHRVNDYIAIDDWQKSIKQLAIEYIKDKHNEWFVMLGQSGAGKTHICSAISKTFLDRGIETRYVVWNTVVKEMKSEMLDGQRTMYELQRVPVLYVDDLFKGRITDTDITLAFDLFNYRYNEKLTTIISSEIEYSKLEEIDSAIAGRINQMSGKFLIEIKKDSSKNYRAKR